MDVTNSTADHDAVIREIASDSMRASYSLSPEGLEGIVRSEFDPDNLTERRENDDDVVLVAEDDGESVGFATGSLVGGDGEIDWLFVDPEAQGRGIGTGLFEAIRDELERQGADTVRALILSENEAGDQFFEQFGYEEIDSREETIAEEEFTINVFGTETSEASDEHQERHRAETIETEDGETVHTGDEEIPGTEAPFLRLYTDSELTEQYGFYCINCGSMANAADGLDRIECQSCGNAHRPDEWDDSYL
ncbi:GNAT family N-acetyltransferase [Natronomonas halophila]|uniref:GNAT family N-acetyltransferase n=1 Tax=Natronomonas halophila TaxID=2747817 RepID=UPI0015B7847F|nr:GNAT family N-acetyltransferase [Natronomonas halophila]QLD86054.1 GNAT family N-acetyltransferase [Natronomonas halophila]